MNGISALAGVLISSAAIAAEAPRLEQFAWLTGCWAFERGGKRYEEVWLRPAADHALGMARTLHAGRTVNYEFTRLAYDADGRAAYIAHPSGQKAAVFPLRTLSGTRAVFENPETAFPRRLIYAYTPPDRLDARIEGQMDGKDAAVDYPFRRIPCPNPNSQTQP